MTKCSCGVNQHYIYWGEMSEAEMAVSGYKYYRCADCNFEPLIWSNAVGDAVCESCGSWQKEIERKGNK